MARPQLKHLLNMSERDHITIRVIPFDAGAFPGSGQSIYYVHGPVPQLDTVHLDQSHGPVFLDAEAQLDKYRVVLDRTGGPRPRPRSPGTSSTHHPRPVRNPMPDHLAEVVLLRPGRLLRACRRSRTGTVHLTESADPTGAILTADPPHLRLSPVRAQERTHAHA